MKIKRLLAGVLSLTLIMTGIVIPNQQADSISSDTEITAEAATTYEGGTLTGANKTELEAFNTSLLSLTGFALADYETTTDESKGVTAGDLITDIIHDRTEYIGTSYYATVSDEREFLQALMDAKEGTVKVIEITEDLDLGWDALALTEEEQEEYSCIAAYGWDTSFEIYNPSIMESGMSQLTIAGIDGLTIFSCSGVTVKHAEWKLQGSSSDIVIRNIKFADMWSFNDSTWDDTKAIGWTPIKINGVKGAWIDHCTIEKGYDGCIDSENGASHITISWCDMGMESDAYEDTSGTIYQTISYMYLLYKAGELGSSSVFGAIMDAYSGDDEELLTMLMAYECYHNKFNLNGSGDQDFKDGSGEENGNQRLHLTMAYNHVTNIIQRYPLLRGGTMHYINCYLDNSGHTDAAEALQKTGVVSSLSKNSTGISARNGASVGVDTCVYEDVTRINTTSEIQGSGANSGYEVAFTTTYNHVEIVNSMAIVDGEDTGYRNSYDGFNSINDYDKNNPFLYSSLSDGTTIGDFRWYSHIDGVDDETRGSAPKDEEGNLVAFTTVYSGSTDAEDGWYIENDLPYSYQTVALEDVQETVETYAGAYTINEDAEFWLSIDYDEDEEFTLASEVGEVTAASLMLDKEETTIQIGDHTKLTAKVSPSNASDKTVTWSSADESVAAVEADTGVVTGVSNGTATITATLGDSELTVTCEVTVTTPVESVEITGYSSRTLYIGDEDGSGADSIQLSAIVTPEDATDTSVTWSSSNSNALKVDENGVLTPLKKNASVTITCASVSNPEITAAVKFIVKEGANPNATETPDESEVPAETADPNESEDPAESENPVDILYGDADGNGAVEVADALKVLRVYVKLDEEPEGDAYTASDVNVDGEINVSDALLILKYYVGLESELPVAAAD